jgi:hypothetical protein
MSNILKKTETNEPFEFALLTQNFTIDVISCMIFGKSFDAQTLPGDQGVRAPDGLLTAFLKVTTTVPERGNIINLLNLKRIWESVRYGR